MIEKLTPERAVRLLRAKAAELEAQVLAADDNTVFGPVEALAADIALVASILADFIQSQQPLRTKTGKILTDEDIQALADEAEAGYDVSHLKSLQEATQERHIRDSLAPFIDYEPERDPRIDYGPQFGEEEPDD